MRRSRERSRCQQEGSPTATIQDLGKAAQILQEPWLRGWSPSSPAHWIKNEHRFLLQERDRCQHSSKLTPDRTGILETVTLVFPNRSDTNCLASDLHFLCKGTCKNISQTHRGLRTRSPASQLLPSPEKAELSHWSLGVGFWVGFWVCCCSWMSAQAS